MRRVGFGRRSSFRSVFVKLLNSDHIFEVGSVKSRLGEAWVSFLAQCTNGTPRKHTFRNNPR